MRNKRPGRGLRAFIILAASLILISGGVLAWYAVSRSRIEIEVFPVSGVAVDWYREGSVTEGRVTSDAAQSVYVSPYDIVVEVLVSEGQRVAAGTPLLACDTELMDLKAQMQALNISISENRIKAKEAQVAAFRGQYPYALANYDPMTPPASSSSESPLSASRQYFSLAENGAEPPVTGGQLPAPAPPPEPEPIGKVAGDSEPYAGAGTESDPFRYFISSGASVTGDFISSMAALEKTEPVYAALELREANLFSGKIYCTWLMIFSPGGGFGFEIFLDESLAPYDPYAPGPDEPPDASPEESAPPAPSGPGYTADEIRRMYRDMVFELEDMRFALRQLRLDYMTTSRLVTDGMVVSELDGVVSGLIDPAYAQMSGMPLLTVSGGEGYYIEGVMSEFDLDAIGLGREVGVFNYYTGANLTGVVVEIGNLPSASYYYGGGNTNTSYYPFKVYVPADSGLAAGNYVELTLQGGSADGAGSLYIERPYIREDTDGSYFTYIRNEEGRLERRAVRVGRMIYGYYYEILSGLTMEDYIAFPYGKNLMDGVRTREADTTYYGKYY